MQTSRVLVFGVLVLGVSLARADRVDAGEFGPNAIKKCRTADWQGIHEAFGPVVNNADGDTVRVRLGKDEYSIRMLSIDTPEKNYQQQNQGEWAYRASERLAELLPPGKRVRLVFEEEYCDTYGRMLAHVFVGKTNINLRMVREGYAVNYCIFPNISYCASYGRAAQQNVQSGLNYYGAEEFIEPYEWRRIVSGRDREKYVGDLSDHLVHDPEEMEQVELGSRVFFMNEDDIAPPFEFAHP